MTTLAIQPSLLIVAQNVDKSATLFTLFYFSNNRAGSISLRRGEGALLHQ